MGQFFSWVKSNEKEILVTLDDLAKKAVQISEELVVMLSDLKIAECHKKIHTIETEADSLVREVFSHLNKTFMSAPSSQIRVGLCFRTCSIHQSYSFIV